MKLKFKNIFAIVTTSSMMIACAPPPASKIDKTYGDSVRNMVEEQKRYPNATVTDQPADGLLGSEADKIFKEYQKSISEGTEKQEELDPGI